MTAGSGITHSEKNASDTNPLHLLQIWILPASEHLEPGYETRDVEDPEESSGLQLIGSPHPSDEAVHIHQDAYLYRGRFGFSLISR